MTLKEYFEDMYKHFKNDWNVETSLEIFGKGNSNEGKEESKSIKRYYVEPRDKRFHEIFLNFDENRNIESVVWFLRKNEEDFLTLFQLKGIFGVFEFHNIIYDETTELTFLPNENKNISYVSTTILEWVEKRKDGTLYFKNGNKEFDFNDDYKVSNIVFKINNNA